MKSSPDECRHYLLGQLRWVGARLFFAAVLSCPLSTAWAQDATIDTLKKITQTKTIVIGHREDAPPFSYRDAAGTVTGYSTDLCLRVAEKIAARLGLGKIDVKYIPSTAATRFLLVKSGKIDLECTTTTNTAERRQQVDFSYPHFLTSTRFVSKKKDHLTSIKDLAGRTVVSTTGTINVEQLQTINRQNKLNISVLLAKQHSEAFAMVEQSKAAAFVMDGILLAALVASSQDPSAYIISQEAFGPPEPYGLLLRKGDNAFKAAVDESLKEIFMSGEINEIYARWFTSPVPPEGRNLNLPMSQELEAAFKNPQEYLD
jgi:glutamate/aspartate transport system substrate-binding protein